MEERGSGMNEYKVIVQWSDGMRSAYFYDAPGIRGAIRAFRREFDNGINRFEIVAVTKKEG